MPKPVRPKAIYNLLGYTKKINGNGWITILIYSEFQWNDLL